MRFAVLNSAALLVALTSAAPALAAPPEIGRWMTAQGETIVEVAPCGAALCGRIVKYLKRDPARALTDTKNPEPALRNRPLTAVNLLSDFTRDGAKWRGRIYDPRSGKTYKGYIAATAAGTLEVTGCLLVFCQTQVWRKA